jgi:peptide/nickel transport system ATP-binding protein
MSNQDSTGLTVSTTPAHGSVSGASADWVLSGRDISITTTISGRKRTLVHGATLSVAHGEAVAIVGESGSGKSLTAKTLIGLLPLGLTSTGSVEYLGQELHNAPERNWRRVRGQHIGLVLQDPFTMLNPSLTCGRQIIETLKANGAKESRAALRQMARERLAEVEITDERVLDSYPHELSGGMQQRVAIAAVLAGNPDVVIADEPSTALDALTQKELLELLARLRRERNMSLILITHDLRVAFSVCDRVYVMYAGSIIETATCDELDATPLHPYSLGLLDAEPPIDRRLERLHVVEGRVPSPDDVSGICCFAPRCEWATPECSEGTQELLDAGAGRLTACRRWAALAPELSHRRSADNDPADGVTVATTVANAAALPLVQVADATKVFQVNGRSGQEDVRALNRVSLQIGLGEAVGIVGASGSGKSTLCRCIVGLDGLTSGEIRVLDETLPLGRKMPADQRRRLRTVVQMVFQDPYSSLNPRRTVGETLSQALLTTADPGELTGARQDVESLLDMVGLPVGYAKRRPVALSGGERQRVGIARALAVRPKLVVFDEPVSGLDVSVQAQILNLLNDLRRQLGISYLFITHDLAVVRQIADRVIVLNHGQIVEQGESDFVLDAPKHDYTKRLVAASQFI